MRKILVIEDNKDVNDLIREALEGEGYEIDSAFDGIEGLKKAEKLEHDLIILDIMLPYRSGDEVLRSYRKLSNKPVIIISAKDLVVTKIDLFKLGADDYITKPFDIGELCARVEANIRRAGNNEKKDSRIKYKDIILDTENTIVNVNDVILTLTAKEYAIMELLMKNQEKVFSKANIYESIWGEEYIGDDNAVKTHMSNLRNKLKKANPNEEYIETVWGFGYRMYKL